MDYDPAVISFRDLLGVFWKSHDPSRQARSTQYKTAVFYHNEQQMRIAGESRDRLAEATGGEVRTGIRPYSGFTVAEDYHQKYYLRLKRELAREYLALYPDLSDFIDSTAVARVNGYVAGYGTPAQLKDELQDLGLSSDSEQLLSRIVSSREH